MDRPRGVVVDETSCSLEGWNDALRGTVVWRTLLSGDRTPSSQLTLGVTELGPGQPSPFHPHRHAQSEIYYVLSGEGVVQIEGEEHRLRMPARASSSPATRGTARAIPASSRCACSTCSRPIPSAT